MTEEAEPVFEVQMHSDMGRTAHPAFNIKVKGSPQDVALPIELGQVADQAGGPMESILTDPEFTLDWIDAHLSDGLKNRFWEDICQDHYEFAKEQASEVFSVPVTIYQEGRSGGWMIVQGLPEDVSEWDEGLRREWMEFAEIVKGTVADVPRAYLTSIYMNEFETRKIADKPAEPATGTDTIKPMGVLTTVGDLYEALAELYELHPTTAVYVMDDNDGSGMHPSLELETLPDGRTCLNIRQRDLS
jgi:hypothetical protein